MQLAPLIISFIVFSELHHASSSSSSSSSTSSCLLLQHLQRARSFVTGSRRCRRPAALGARPEARAGTRRRPGGRLLFQSSWCPSGTVLSDCSRDSAACLTMLIRKTIKKRLGCFLGPPNWRRAKGRATPLGLSFCSLAPPEAIPRAAFPSYGECLLRRMPPTAGASCGKRLLRQTPPTADASYGRHCPRSLPPAASSPRPRPVMFTIIF